MQLLSGGEMSTLDHSIMPLHSHSMDERKWINLQKKHVDRIIILHRLLLAVFIAELLFNISRYFYKNGCIFGVAPQLIMFGKQIATVQSLTFSHISEMRTSLLVVWTFLTVIVMYFAEHESKRIYGQTVADLAISVLGKKTNALLIHAVLELWILLLSTIIKIPLALSILLVIMPMTTYYAIYFVLHDASSVNLLPLFKNLFKNDIKADWMTWNSLSSNTPMRPVHWRFLSRFSSMIDNMDFGLSNDYDFVLSIIPHLLYFMMEMKDDTEIPKNTLPKCIQWDIPYESVKIVMRGVTEGQRVKLGQDMMRVLQDPDNKAIFKNDAVVDEVLAVISLYPIIYADDSRNPIQDFKNLLLGVKDESTDRSKYTKIILRAIMYNLFLEVSPNRRSLITVQLTRLLSDYDEQNTQIYEEAFHYWWELSRKYSNHMRDASDLSHYLNIYIY